MLGMWTLIFRRIGNADSVFEMANERPSMLLKVLTTFQIDVPTNVGQIFRFEPPPPGPVEPRQRRGQLRVIIKF